MATYTALSSQGREGAVAGERGDEGGVGRCGEGCSKESSSPPISPSREKDGGDGSGGKVEDGGGKKWGKGSFGGEYGFSTPVLSSPW